MLGLLESAKSLLQDEGFARALGVLREDEDLQALCPHDVDHFEVGFFAGDLGLELVAVVDLEQEGLWQAPVKTGLASDLRVSREQTHFSLHSGKG